MPSVPGYKVLGLLGHGGMGIVYQAEQLGLHRLVALKMIGGVKSGEGGSRSRFRTEIRAVARLHHPNIVQIFDVGEAGGVPYFSMEYVDGKSLADKLAGLPQPQAEAAGVVELLARAVQFAHEHGIVHRDLKPANILLTSMGAPKIADFGLAKLEVDPAGSAGSITVSSMIQGTPSYMAPEQANTEAGRQRIGPAADVYALGAILYEMLTGQAPFKAKSSLETVLQVLHHDPTPPRRFRPEISRDLETICLRCLAKDPARRFASAADLAEDLRRFRAGEPIRSRPVSPPERLWRWCRRNPVVATLSLSLILVLVSSLLLVTWKWRAEIIAGNQARLQKQNADQARNEAERLATRALVNEAINQGDNHHVDRALHLFVQALELAQKAEARDLEHAIRLNLNAWRWQLVRPRASLQHADWVWAVAYSPDGKRCATASRDKTARLWDTRTGQPIGKPLEHQFPVWSLAFSPDGNRLLTGSGDPNGDQGEIKLWEVPTGKLASSSAKAGLVSKLMFHPDGQEFLVLGAGSARLWKADTMSEYATLPHPGSVLAAIFSPDGKRILTGASDGTARLWRTDTAAVSGEPLVHTEEPSADRRCDVVALAFSPDGKQILTGTRMVDTRQGRFLPSEVGLWSSETGERIGKAWPHPGPLNTVLFSPDGRRALTAGIVIDEQAPPGEAGKQELTGEARLWEVGTGQPIGPLLKQSQPIWSAAFSPNGQIVLTGSEGGNVQFWAAATGLPVSPPMQRFGNVNAVAFSPDGRTALTSRTYENAAATLWEAPQGPGDIVPSVRVPEITCLAVHPDGKILGTAGADGQVQLWNWTVPEPLGPPLPHASKVNALAFNSTGTLLATAINEQATVWDVATGRVHGAPFRHDGVMVLCVAFSPDGKTLVTGTSTGFVRVWDVASGKQLCAPLQRVGAVQAVAFHPGGQSFAAGSEDRILQYNLQNLQPRGNVLPHEGGVRALAYSPDGRTLVSSSFDHTVRLWDIATEQPVQTVLEHQADVVSVAFSADGKLLLTGSTDGDALLWDAATALRIGPMLAHPSGIWATLPPKSTQLVTIAEDGYLRHWNLPVPVSGQLHEIKAWVEELTHKELAHQGILRERIADHR